MPDEFNSRQGEKGEGRFAAAALSFAAASAPASISWNWTGDGGNDKGTFTTGGSDAYPLGAGNYTISDAAITQSTIAPVGSVSGGSYVFYNRPGFTAPPYHRLERHVRY